MPWNHSQLCPPEGDAFLDRPFVFFGGWDKLSHREFYVLAHKVAHFFLLDFFVVVAELRSNIFGVRGCLYEAFPSIVD